MRLALCLLTATLLTAQQDPPSRVARLNYASGPVSFQPAGEPDWLDAPINRPLIPGDSLWVAPNARAELHIGSSAVRLNSNTAFQLLNLDDQTTQIRLSEGILTVRVRQWNPGEVLEIDTPNVAFNIYAPGEYRIDAQPGTLATMVTVRAGNGEVLGGGQSFPLATGQQAFITGDQQISYRLNASPYPDAWDQWCQGRDRREEQSVSARYISREMAGYEDLDPYGSWSSQPGYGDVWMPASVAAGWAPYRNGHWAWISPWGWTWVDDAPWGFAPYHYGRWAMFGNRWGWVPGPRGVAPTYAPALVGWVGGAGFGAAVGWFALGPREPYFPAYNVSQNYFRRVNTSNTVINVTNIDVYYQNSRGPNNNVINSIQYRNRQLPNAVISVPRDTFAGGRRIGQSGRMITPSQLNGTQVFSSPNIAPRRESVLASRGPGRGAQPPAAAFNRSVVARTAPAPAAVPFQRQQEALRAGGGRPLAPDAVQRLRQSEPAQSAHVRLLDPSKSRRGVPQQATQTPPQAPGRQQPQFQQPVPQQTQQQPQPARKGHDRAPQQPQAQQPQFGRQRQQQTPQQPQFLQPVPQQTQQQPQPARKGHDRAPQQPQVQHQQQVPQQPPFQQPQPARKGHDRAPQQPQAQPPQVQQPQHQQPAAQQPQHSEQRKEHEKGNGGKPERKQK